MWCPMMTSVKVGAGTAAWILGKPVEYSFTNNLQVIFERWSDNNL